ncbi:MAG: Glycerophosphodiester phosphodiesterase, cytoplasmic [Burkholderia plantarii]|nr:MAG: Glycerophosphodiester phosphodiesterase, cytoplasmic [Burkholderia plantarii]
MNVDDEWVRHRVRSGGRADAAWRGTRVVAHRLGGTLAPENTLAGIDACVRYCCGIVECDAKLSVDDSVYLLHDDDLDRTTDGHGPAVTRPWHELATLDAGSWFGPAFVGERLPRLEALAARCARQALAVNLEIKPCPGTEVRTGARVAQAAAALWAGRPAPLLSSFSLPALPRAILFEALPDDWQASADALDCVSLHVHHVTLTREQVEAIHASGRRVLVYTVNDAERAGELARWGVDLICTDRPDRITTAGLAIARD